uniref:phosphoserine phosphatase n=1 Tax=Thaumasiovibrio occultus TaxID=1891184 RepID=UPI000B359A76|nr:phosphoserine phosphatase [Thaumasiovibrio occultus]
MNGFAPLAIRRKTGLRQRFAQGNYCFRDYRKSSWVLFGPNLMPAQLAQIAQFSGDYPQVVDSWQVGSYDVLLIAGDLASETADVVRALGLDCAATSELPELAEPGVVVFDMDSTAIQIECIDEIAKLAGVGEQVAEVTERAMQGELDFEQSLRQRVATLKGADVAILDTVRQQLPLMPGMGNLVKTFQQFNWQVAIASGGFTYFSDHLKTGLDLTAAYSNQLGIENGKLTGEVIGEVVDAQRKAEILQMLADQYDVDRYNTVAVGDGANDLPMMHAAGTGIAFRAKPKVVEQAQKAVIHADLTGVMCLLSASLLPQRLSWQIHR